MLYLLEKKLDDYEIGEIRSFVIRAKSSKKARGIASTYGGDKGTHKSELWLNPKHSNCRKIQSNGRSKVISIETDE